LLNQYKLNNFFEIPGISNLEMLYFTMPISRFQPVAAFLLNSVAAPPPARIGTRTGANIIPHHPTCRRLYCTPAYTIHAPLPIFVFTMTFTTERFVACTNACIEVLPFVII
jgi:hypothetical protein